MNIREMYEKLKANVIECVVWAEKELSGKSGAEKKAAVKKRLDEMIPLPFYLEWADDLLIDYLIEVVCSQMNAITSRKVETVTDVKKMAAVIDLPENVLLDEGSKDLSVDERLEELYRQYDIKADVVPVAPVASTVKAEGAGNAAYAKSIDFLLKWEGGYVDHPNDKGGPTNRGITIPVLKVAQAQGVVKHCNIKDLTKQEAMAIYKTNYWNHHGWNELAWAVCAACLDISVNHGPRGWALIVQRACNKLGAGLTVDGKYGAKSKAALWSLAKKEPKGLALAICEMKQDYYNRIVAADESQKVFLKGWTNRVNALRSLCVG